MKFHDVMGSPRGICQL